MIFPKTIQDGNAVIAWKRDGTRKIIEGPTVLFAPLDTIYPLQRVIAREEEYLVIEYQDGRTEHRAGPCKIWFDPLLHLKIYPKETLNLDAHEAIVIYDDTRAEVIHRVLNGPAVYIPKPTEWLHQFRWHGDNGTGHKVPRQLKFEKLRVIPDQLYFDVESVRTADEALITVQLMVFFELDDIEKMLHQTHDPVADFINAVAADIIRFAGNCDFESFKTQADALNNIDTYIELYSGAERIGYKINKVVYRGYIANDKLQKMHDDAIELRTGLVLETETEEQQQELSDLKLGREHSRAAQIRKEEDRTQGHHLEQMSKDRDQKLTTRREEEELEIRLTQQRHDAEQKHRQELLELHFEEWNHLHQAGADLTAVLVAQEHNPDKTIRLEQNGGAEVHLHEAV